MSIPGFGYKKDLKLIYLTFSGQIRNKLHAGVALSQKVQGSLWTPGLIENGKLGAPERNIEVPTRVALVINNRSVHKMVI